MGINLIDKYYLEVELNYKDMNNLVAEFILDECKELKPFNIHAKDAVGKLFLYYFLLKKVNNHHELDKILSNYSLNYTSVIHNAIYDMLEDNPVTVLWPFVSFVEKCGSFYTLNTCRGSINVYKASDIFKNSKSSYIFKRQLKEKCFARSFDFLSENRDYKAVLSYDDNLFVGGHFHAYLEKEDITLDIASNALYKSREERDKVLKGEIITKLTYEEATDSFNKVLEEVPDLDRDDDKLQVLALYYGKKKGIK